MFYPMVLIQESINPIKSEWPHTETIRQNIISGPETQQNRM